MSSEIVQRREKLFNDMLEYYKKLATTDERYLKTCARLEEGKEKFMEGWTYAQVIQGYKN